MAAEGNPYRGILYAGLMLTDKGPQVIEFNCRFGDPEAQVIFTRMKSICFPPFIPSPKAAKNFDMRWDEDSAVTIVMAAKGYPDSYKKGSRIYGADQLESATGCLVSMPVPVKMPMARLSPMASGFYV